MPKICYDETLNFRAKSLDLIDTANAIIGEYQRAGFTLTLRQLYYQFVSRDIIPNSEKSYNMLGGLVTNARIAGLIDWEAIEDRGRGVKPWLIQESQLEVLDGIEYHLALDFWTPQDMYIECWVEKEALAGVIERPCNKWRVPYMSCKGYLSASEAWRAGQRFKDAQDAGKTTLVIHLGDHDPSGIDMTRDNIERLAMFSEGHVEVERIALNMNQVRQYNPPENPAKLTDTRASDYIAKHGHSSWELDALNPKILNDLIENTIKQYVDIELWDATKRKENALRTELAKLHGNWDAVKEFVQDIEE